MHVVIAIFAFLLWGRLTPRHLICPITVYSTTAGNFKLRHYRAAGQSQRKMGLMPPPPVILLRLCPRGTFKVDPGPGEHGVSVLFKPTQSTIVFSITSPGALATEYQVYHVNAGGFRRFSETEVVEAARELALHFVERAGPR
jgi:hypothetical protein